MGWFSEIAAEIAEQDGSARRGVIMFCIIMFWLVAGGTYYLLEFLFSYPTPKQPIPKKEPVRSAWDGLDEGAKKEESKSTGYLVNWLINKNKKD